MESYYASFEQAGIVHYNTMKNVTSYEHTRGFARVSVHFKLYPSLYRIMFYYIRHKVTRC